MAYIDVIQPDQAEGRLKEIYDEIESTRGQIAEVHKIQSLNPETIVNHMDLYMSVMYAKSPLRRATREMIAVVVSMANNCEYCQTHHGAALNHYWKDEARVQQLRTDYRSLDLPAIDKLWCELAYQITSNPSKSTAGIYERLRAEGAEDRAILDANLVIAYFNFVNRLVLGLGVHLEADQGVGYNY